MKTKIGGRSKGVNHEKCSGYWPQQLSLEQGVDPVERTDWMASE